MKRHGTLFVLALALAVAAYAAADSHTAKVGAAAPGFTLNDETGKPHALSDYRGKIVVLEWTNPECPFVKRHYQAGTMKNLDEQFGENVVWLAVNSSHFNEPEDSVKWRSENGFAYPTLQDPDGEVGTPLRRPRPRRTCSSWTLRAPFATTAPSTTGRTATRLAPTTTF